MERVCRDSGVLAALALLAALVSGVLLAFEYAPTTLAAYHSVLGLRSPALRGLHAHATHAALGLTLLHAILALWASSRWTRPGLWLTGVGAALLTVVAAYGGRVLPWDLHGATSQTVAEQLFGFGFGSLAAQSVLHGLLSVALVGLAAWHIVLGNREVSRDGGDAGHTGQAREDPRWRRERWLLPIGLVALWALALLVDVPLDARYQPLALQPQFVGAEWYLRWLQWIGIAIGPNAARVSLVLLIAALVCTPLAAKRVGAARLRWGWLAALALLALLTALPSGLPTAGGSG
jgi:hypothetical protein